jgi:hypothetical protein
MVYRYAYGDGFGKHSPCRKQRLSIGTESAFRVLAMFEQYFSGDYPVFYATDIGTWELTMTDEAVRAKRKPAPYAQICLLVEMAYHRF